MNYLEKQFLQKHASFSYRPENYPDHKKNYLKAIDILVMSDKDTELAETVIALLDWEHPLTIIDGLIIDGDVIEVLGQKLLFKRDHLPDSLDDINLMIAGVHVENGKHVVSAEYKDRDNPDYFGVYNQLQGGDSVLVKKLNTIELAEAFLSHVERLFNKEGKNHQSVDLLALDEARVDSLAEQALNQAVSYIQDKIGQEDGGVAGLFFSDEGKELAVKEVLKEYINLEASYAKDRKNDQDEALERSIKEVSYNAVKDYEYTAIEGVAGILIDETKDCRVIKTETGYQSVTEVISTAESEESSYAPLVNFFFESTFDKEGRLISSAPGLTSEMIEDCIQDQESNSHLEP